MKRINNSIFCRPIKNDYSLEIFVHSNNVANIALAIAEELQLSNEDKNQLFEVALYHDIGKSKVPEDILYKNGKLTGKEWEIMKQHTIFSEDLYLNFTNMDHPNIRKAKAIRHHHENWDGSGYPDRLSGHNIPLYSRIIRIADILDAITQPRVYRPYKLKEPLKVLQEEKGKAVDPELLDRCYGCLHQLVGVYDIP